MAQPVGGDGFSKTVVLLKEEDCERRNGKVYMPNTIEMAKIKKPDRGQYKTNVQFSKIMGKDMVRQRLHEEFPTFDLMNVRFSCAAVSQDSITFQFHGTPCVWDGRTIKRLIKGNSVLYIVMEYDQMDVSSGISASDSDSLQAADVTEMSSLIPWLQNNLHFDVECNPNYSPLQGGGPCVFTFTPKLHSEVTSVYATFEGLGTQKLEYLKLGFFPASPVPAVVNVTLQSQDGIILGKTRVTYGANLQQVVSSPSVLKKFCEDYMSGNPSGNISGNGEGETENSRALGCSQPLQMLSLLVYVAAEIGAQQFLEIIFTSSAGRVVFNSYKENLTLPEVIARDHGKEETANYLEDVTKRFSDENTTGKECSQTIDWCELMKAAEAAEKELDLTSEKEDIPKDTGYLGDIDTSSSESSEAQSSDSDDDISRTSRKETRMKAKTCKQRVWQHKDHAIEANVASLLFLKDGVFPRGKANVITYFKTKTLKWKENGLHLIQASRFQEAYNVRKAKYLQDSGISFLLGLANLPVQQHLITTYQRLGYLLTLSSERNAYYKMLVDTAEDLQLLKHLSITVGNKGDYKASRLDALQQLCCRLINGEFTAAASREDLIVRGKSAECLMELCQSAALNFWVLTYIFRPTRKTLFIYVTDNKDVFPPVSCFDDRQYELSWGCQQWQECKNNAPKVQEIYKLPAIPSNTTVQVHLALEGYMRTLVEASRTCCMSVMLIGQEGSGKTSLKKSLRGEPFNPDEKSTIGIQVDLSHFKVSNEIWKVGEEDHNSETSISFECRAVRASVENLKKEKMVPSPEETEEHDSIPKDTDNQAIPPKITVRGRLASEGCNRALAERKTCDTRVPLVVMKLLRAKRFNPVDFHAARAFLENLKKGKMVPSPEETEEHDSVPKDTGNQGNRSDETSHDPESVQAVRYTEQDDSIPKDTAIPPKITVLGRLALEGYNGALAEGKTCDKSVPVMVVGHGGSGKTSVKKSLRGEPFNPDEKSTIGIEVETSISVECHAAQASVENLKKEKMVPSPEETEEHDSVPKDIGNQGNRSDETSHNPESVQAVRYTEQDDSIPKDTGNQGNRSDDDPESVEAFRYFDQDDSIPKDIETEMVKRLVNDGNVDGEDVHSVLWNFAGQSVYYIRKLLDSWKTHLDYLDFWMSAIASLANQEENDQESVESEVLPEKLPPVFSVCTHADMPYESQVDRTTLTRELFGPLQNKPYNIHLSDLFVVDNTISVRGSECPEVVRLRQEVLAVSKALPQMKGAIPIKWLKYEKELQAMKGVKKCIDQDALRTMASEACNIFDDQEFQTLLNFLHDKRILIHFSDTPELDKLAVLDPQWLIDVFKEVLTVRPYNLKERKFQTLWNKLENDVILEGTLLESVCAPLVGQETFESLVGIMEKFSLVCSWPSSDASWCKQHLVPSMLMSHPPESTMSLLASARIPPPFPKFESGQVPLGLFPRLALQCFQWDQEEQGEPQLNHNIARFYTSQKEGCSLIFLYPASLIGVVVHKGTSQDLADSLQSNLSCSADVGYDTCEVTCAHAVRKKLGLKLEVRNRSMCRTNSRMIKGSRGDFSSENKRCVSLTVDKHNGGNLRNEQESSVKRKRESPCTSQKRPKPMPEHLAVERGELESNICQKLVEKEWRTYDVENIPSGIEGIYCIGVVSGARGHFNLGEPTVLYVGRTNDVHRRLVEHKRRCLKIDLYVKEKFEDNGGVGLRIKWIKEKNQETKEKEYIECIAHKLGYWPKYNVRR